MGKTTESVVDTDDPIVPADATQIDVPEDDPAPATPVTVDPAADAEVETARKSLTNAAFAAMRKENTDAKKTIAELQAKQKEIEERLSRQPAPVHTTPDVRLPPRRTILGTPVPENPTEWNDLARKDWQLAVDMRAIIAAEKIQEEARTAERSVSVLEESKQEVLERHPELADANTEKSRLFSDILRQFPQYASHPEGPILIMHKMEREMKRRGMTDTPAPKTQTDSTRESRAALTAAGKTTEKPARTVTLSAEDLEFCKSQGIDPKVYAKERLENDARRKGAQL